jgi:hypothetical protein
MPRTLLDRWKGSTERAAKSVDWVGDGATFYLYNL